MVTATNVDATAVNTIGWLSTGRWSIVVPVYQRQYRWDIGDCEQLLSDIRAVARLDDAHMHFIGSVLSSVDADGAELVLIDGQQRITTLMLLIAALHHAVGDSDPELSGHLARVLFPPQDRSRTRLRPHPAWAATFERVILGTRGDATGTPSRFDDNYAFFRSQITADEAGAIWRGLQKLEHVAITLRAGANAQQIFESLNSTGAPLRDHELIHNYVLMGLSHTQQREIEELYWLPIEEATGDAIAEFWRHYLVMVTGRDVAAVGGRAVYDVFRQVFPLLEPASLLQHARQWREYAVIYRALLDPAEVEDPVVAGHLSGVATFGTEMYPLLMAILRDHALGEIDRDALLAILELLQSLLLRRSVVGVSNERLVARLCRAREDGHAALVRAAARIMPSDDRVRVALKHSELPHPRYVLTRLSGTDPAAEFDVDHVFPLAPADTWSGDGVRTWSSYSDDEQNSLRALSGTLGNLALVEEEIGERVFDSSFPGKRTAYARSAVDLTAEIARSETWSTAAISARSAALADRFMEVWRRPETPMIDDDGLTPILDAIRRRGWPRGWQREWAYVEYRGEHWEVPDLKYLFNRVFKRLWADARPAVEAYSARRGGPVYTSQAWSGQWDRIDDEHSLYMGWDYSYMLGAVQGVLEEAGIAPEVFVKYSYIGEAM